MNKSDVMMTSDLYFIIPSQSRNMKNRMSWRYAKILIGVILTAIVGASIPLSKSESDCFASDGQTVVNWKSLYYRPCKHSWNSFCLWPIRRKHFTYKVTVTEGTPVRNELGKVIPIASGKRRNWEVYDSTAWTELENSPRKKNRFEGYEPIADNEYVVIVETRYVLFHDVKANLRICTQMP